MMRSRFGLSLVAAATVIGFGVTSALADGNTVCVAPGNTLWTISKSYGVSLLALEAANPSVNANDLLVGTVLHLPIASGSAAPMSSSPDTVQQQNLYWMERAINAEAGGEPLQTQIAVGDVILHRLQSGGYGNTVKDVVFQVIDGHYQFTSVADGYIYTPPAWTSVRAAKDVLYAQDDVVPGAMVFYNPAYTPATSWVRQQPYIAAIGALVFAK